MFGLPLPPTAATAVLLVLLPPAVTVAAQLVRATIVADLNQLQQQLTPVIQVLHIDEASHPAIVHSFDGRGLPAFVLIREGVELWHQQGLPTADTIVAQLLSKLHQPNQPTSH